MDQGGTRCLYDREGSLIWLVEHLHAMGYWVWIVLVLMLSCCCWQFRGALAKHWHLLTFARMHYHLCKVRKNPKVHAGGTALLDLRELAYQVCDWRWAAALL
ncbi:unnamed protein product [Durusdinium trenchii]|uniref:Uncharacterized protein n=1 Tax=Durusdinium trenchii TaxID=1381693 RepID=A0ABP0KUD5_9DINO